MVASKRIHCVICNKKCSGNVLRYQDQYYHKQCFELEQSQGASIPQKQQEQREPTQRHDQQAGSRVGGLDVVDSNVALITSGESRQSTNYNANQSSRSQLSILNNNNNNESQDYTYNNSPQTVGGQQQRLAGATSYSHMATSARATPAQRRGPATMGASSAGSQLYQQQQHQQQQMKSQTMDTRSSRREAASSSDAATATGGQIPTNKSATLPHSTSAPVNGFLSSGSSSSNQRQFTNCAGCGEKIRDGQALIALDLHWHVWCFKCNQCQVALHGEYVAKEGKAYCEKDYQKLFGVTCVYCKRYITGKVLQAGEAHHFHPSCARCSKCGDPFVPGEEMYLQGEVTWHPRCGPGPAGDPTGEGAIDELVMDSSTGNRSQLRASRGHSPSFSSRSQSRSASPFSFMSRQYGRSSPGYADSEAVGDLSRVYTISYLNADPTQGYLRRPIEPHTPKSPQFSRPTSVQRGDRSRSSSRSHLANHHHHQQQQQHHHQQQQQQQQQNNNYYSGGSHLSRERSVPRGMYSVLSGMSRGSQRARSPSMMNEEAIHLAQYPSGQKPSPDTVPKIERDDFPAPPFPYPKHGGGASESAQAQATAAAAAAATGTGTGSEEQQVQQASRQKPQQRSSRPKSREIVLADPDSDTDNDDPQLRKEEEELSKIANGIGKIFLQTLKEREKLRAWKRANLDPRNASRTPSATRELPTKLRYDNPTNASPSRDMDRPRPWEEEQQEGAGEQQHSPTRTRSSLGRHSQMSPTSTGYGYKVVQSNRSTPRPGYGLTGGPYGEISSNTAAAAATNKHNGFTGAGSTMAASSHALGQQHQQDLLFGQQQQQQQQVNAHNRSNDLLARAAASTLQSELITPTNRSRSFGSVHMRRSMPNVNINHLLHLEGPPKLYPYHLLATSNYRLPPDVDRCHLERHLSNEEFQYIFHCDRLDFYRLPEWKRNELKRRAKLF